MWLALVTGLVLSRVHQPALSLEDDTAVGVYLDRSVYGYPSLRIEIDSLAVPAYKVVDLVKQASGLTDANIASLELVFRLPKNEDACFRKIFHSDQAPNNLLLLENETRELAELMTIPECSELIFEGQTIRVAFRRALHGGLLGGKEVQKKGRYNDVIVSIHNEVLQVHKDRNASNPYALAHICGGVLLGGRMVLSAAHCFCTALCKDTEDEGGEIYRVPGSSCGDLEFLEFTDPNPVDELYGITANTHDLDKTAKVRHLKIAHVMMHEKFVCKQGPGSSAHDVAIVALEEVFPEGSEFLRANVILPHKSTDTMGQDAFVLGWGYNKQDESQVKAPHRLRRVKGTTSADGLRCVKDSLFGDQEYSNFLLSEPDASRDAFLRHQYHLITHTDPTPDIDISTQLDRLFENYDPEAACFDAGDGFVVAGDSGGPVFVGDNKKLPLMLAGVIRAGHRNSHYTLITDVFRELGWIRDAVYRLNKMMKK